MTKELVWRFTTREFDCVVLEEPAWADPLVLHESVIDAIDHGLANCVDLSAEVRLQDGTLIGRAGKLQLVQPIESDETGLSPDYIVSDRVESRRVMRAAIKHARQTIAELGQIPGSRIRLREVTLST